MKKPFYRFWDIDCVTIYSYEHTKSSNPKNRFLLVMSRIVVVEDDTDIAEVVSHHLRKAGYETEVITSGNEVLSRLLHIPPDLVILDLMLPGMNGIEVCRAIRTEKRISNIPIIMLTAKVNESDRIIGLEIGADDYVTKPFSPKELVARVGAVLRRVNGIKESTQSLQFASLVVDTDRHQVTLDGQDVRLTGKEFLLLKYFIENQDRVLSRDVLLSNVWGYRYTGGTRTVDVHIRHLREKLPVLASTLVTIKQFGYKLVKPASPNV